MDFIGRLFDVDSQQVCTQTEPEDIPVCQQDSNAEEASLLAEIKDNLPFPDGISDPEYWVLANEESRPASLALQALIDLSDVDLDCAFCKRKKWFVVFVDFSKVYDRLDRVKLVNILKKLGCAMVMLVAIVAMYGCPEKYPWNFSYNNCSWRWTRKTDLMSFIYCFYE